VSQNPTHDQLPLIGNVLPTDLALLNLVADEHLHIFGHGTATQSSALGSINKGLYLNSAHLWSTAIGMVSTTDNPNAYEANKVLIENWPHHNQRFVVILGVERLKLEDVPHRRYLQSIVQVRKDITEANDTHGSPYVINPRFIAGYFNVVADIFVVNPNFDPRYDVALLETTADDKILGGRKPTPMLKFIGQPAVGEGHQKQLPQEYHDKAPDIW
jgi:hypothetical protein